jgi:hypothetical protein
VTYLVATVTDFAPFRHLLPTFDTLEGAKAAVEDWFKNESITITEGGWHFLAGAPVDPPFTASGDVWILPGRDASARRRSVTAVIFDLG